MIQLALAIFGLSSLWMAMGRNATARQWAPVVGLMGQPFWFAFAWSADGWGLMILVCAYTAVYARGAWLSFRETAVNEEEMRKAAGLSFDDALRLARGCTDYRGGHHGDAYEAYQHGIQTVVNVLTAAQKKGLSEYQIAVLHAIGSEVKS